MNVTVITENDSKRNQFNIVVVGKFIGLAVLLLITTEITLHIVGLIYSVVRRPYVPNQVLGTSATSTSQENEYKFMFIGDSWTVGVDAPLGQGYTDVLHNLLMSSAEGYNFSFINLAKSSNNSSEALVKFTRGYEEFRPHFLIVLFGLNNSWNTYDVEIANKELGLELGIYVDENENLLLSNSAVTNALRKLKLVRLYSLIKFELVDRKIPLQYGLPGSQFGVRYFTLNNDDRDSAFDYLVDNYQKADSYDDFFRYVLYHFEYNSQDAIDSLLERNIYFPDRMTVEFDQEKHDQYIKHFFSILEGQVELIKELCDRNNIILIMQTYPEVEDGMWTSELNTMLRLITTKHSIRLVDHEQIFRSKYSLEEWKNIKTKFHVSSVGYADMADNIHNYLQDEGLF